MCSYVEVGIIVEVEVVRMSDVGTARRTARSRGSGRVDR